LSVGISRQLDRQRLHVLHARHRALRANRPDSQKKERAEWRTRTGKAIGRPIRTAYQRECTSH
jgi:hypothetical protein